MDRLSALDASFLYGETPESPMHVAGLAIFAPAPAGTDLPGGVRLSAVRFRLESATEGPARVVYKLMKYVFLGPFLRLVFPCKVVGAEYIPAEGGAILAGNQNVDARSSEGRIAFDDVIDDRLAGEVERGVEKDWDTRTTAVRLKQRVKTRRHFL